MTTKNTPTFALRLPAPIKVAAESWCATHGVTLSAAIIGALCRQIGREDLIGSVRPRGRQPKPETDSAESTCRES